MFVPPAHVQQTRFRDAIERIADDLAPEVVTIIPTFGNDWSGEPAVFLMVILSDDSSRHDRILDISNRVSETIVQQVEPLEQWGVFPYFNFRSQSEQAKLDQPAVA